MLVFGHTGITLGTAIIIDRLTGRHSNLVSEQNRKTTAVHSNSSVFSLADGRVDIRLLMVGSLLPDIIDKPLGFYFFRETLGSGWLYGHTTIFLAILILIGIYNYRERGSVWCLTLAFGTFTHLIFDGVWLKPRVLLWPAYGFEFPKTDVTDLATHYLEALLTFPYVYVPEIMGAGILLSYLWILVRRHRLTDFIRQGRA